MSELKACPFCNAELSIYMSGHKISDVRCENCGLVSTSLVCDNKAEVVRLLNTRPIEDAMQAEIDRLIELQRKMPLVADRRGAELSDLRVQHTRLIDQCKRLANELLGYVGADGNAPGSAELSNFDRLMKELDV